MQKTENDESAAGGAQDAPPQESIERVNLALDSGIAGVWDWDIERNEFHWSSQFRRMFGLDPSAVPGFETWRKAVHPDDREAAERKIRESIDGGTELDSEYRIILPNREQRWIRATGKTVYESGKPIRMIGLCADITRLRKADEAFRTSEERFHAIAANTPDHIFMQDADLRYTFVINPQMGLTEAGMVGKTDRDILRPEDAEKLTSIKSEVLATGKPFHLDTSLADAEGRLEYFDGNYIPTTDAEGRINGLIGYFRNVTGQRQAEADLKRMSEILSEGQKIAHQGSFEFIAGTGETIWSEEEFRIYGLPPGPRSPAYEDMLKRLIHPEDAATLDEAFKKAVEEGSAYELEHRIVRPDGSVATVYDLAHPYFDEGGKLVKYIGTTLDITERKNAEEVMQRAQKLESLGLLAGGIAHDFNNLMGGIYGYIEIAKAEADREKASSYLAKALSTIDRARALSGQLLTFASGGAPIRKLGSLTPFLQETALFALSGMNVSCRFDVQEGLWACSFDKNQIGQVIENIVINAQQAMAQGGTIELSARNVEIGEKAHPTLPGGAYVRITVKDQGVGIPKEQLARVFDPFFTTKATGHGLGLATCFSIVNRHGGCIDVESEPGRGSSFHVYLPASLGAVPAQAEKPSPQHRGAGLFLVMDDEEVMRDSLGGMLRSFGYEVVCVNNGREAIDFIASGRDGREAPAAMVFDLTVPGEMGGREAAEAIRKLDGKTPIFVSSGYADDPIMRNPSEFGFTASIRKPFRASELIELLNAHLENSQ